MVGINTTVYFRMFEREIREEVTFTRERERCDDGYDKTKKGAGRAGAGLCGSETSPPVSKSTAV
jgi:hypothetical protein